MNNESNELIQKTAAVAKGLEADVFLYVGTLFRPNAESVFGLCDGLNSNRAKNALLILATFGGDAHATYRIGRCLQQKYQKLFILIPSFCKSAGTLLAMAADELILADRAELGPLDVQLSKQDDIIGRESGLDSTNGLEYLRVQTFEAFEEYLMKICGRSQGSISTSKASEIASNLAVATMAPIFQQLNPIRLGSIQRSISIAFEYGKRLNEKPKNLRDTALLKLVSGYPAHEFAIGYRETSRLFYKVRKPNEEELSLLEMLESAIAQVHEDRPIVQHLPIEVTNKKEEPHAKPAQQPRKPGRTDEKREPTLNGGHRSRPKRNGKRNGKHSIADDGGGVGATD